MKSAYFAATALVAALMAGCKDEPKNAPAPAPAPAPATDPATPATSPTTPATQPSSAIPGLPGGVELPSIPSAPSTPSIPPPPSTPDVPAAAAGAADDVQTNAKNWMAEADKALKSGKFGDAQQIVDKLNGIKASLSPEWQEKINQLSSAVEKAKTLKVPGVDN